MAIQKNKTLHLRIESELRERLETLSEELSAPFSHTARFALSLGVRMLTQHPLLAIRHRGRADVELVGLLQDWMVTRMSPAEWQAAFGTGVPAHLRKRGARVASAAVDAVADDAAELANHNN